MVYWYLQLNGIIIIPALIGLLCNIQIFCLQHLTVAMWVFWWHTELCGWVPHPLWLHCDRALSFPSHLTPLSQTRVSAGDCVGVASTAVSSWRQTTRVLAALHSSEQTRPHWPPKYTSTIPSKWLESLSGAIGARVEKRGYGRERERKGKEREILFHCFIIKKTF